MGSKSYTDRTTVRFSSQNKLDFFLFSPTLSRARDPYTTASGDRYKPFTITLSTRAKSPFLRDKDQCADKGLFCYLRNSGEAATKTLRVVAKCKSLANRFVSIFGDWIRNLPGEVSQYADTFEHVSYFRLVASSCFCT